MDGLWPLDLKFNCCPIVQRYVSTKSEVSMAFLYFQKLEARK